MKIQSVIKITQIVEHKTGIGKTGNEWHRMTVIVITNDQVYFPAQCWGKVQSGEYSATIEIKGREWNGKHYPEILLSDLVVIGQVVEPVQEAQNTLHEGWKQEVKQPETETFSIPDDLPF